MAVNTITIDGKVVKPDGSGADRGEIRVTLSEFGTVDDAGTEQVVSKVKKYDIASNGDVNFEIIPNADINTASGTSFYRVTFKLHDGDTWTEIWQVATSPTTQNIGDVTRIIPSTGDPAWLVDTLPTAASKWRGVRLVLKGASGIQDKEYVCLKTTAVSPDVYVWIPGLVGGGPGW